MELLTVGGAASNDLEHGAEVFQGLSLCRAPMNVNEALVSSVGTVECSVQGGKESLATGDGKTSVLALP